MLKKWTGALEALKDRTLEKEEGSAESTPGTTPAPKLLPDSRAIKLHLCGYDIEGVSIAGQETSISLPRCKVVFDIGRCPQRSVFQQTVLVSHGHLDHIGGAAFHATSRSLQSLPPSKFVCQGHYVEGLKKLIEVSNSLQGDPPLEYEVQPLEVGQELQLPSGYLVRPFPTVHGIPSQGYLLYSQRKKLKAELLGKSQADIRALREAGEEVTDTITVPEVAFTGDTTGELFEQEGVADIFQAKLLIVEMTFVDDTVTIDQAREKGHMHIADFVAHAHKFNNEAILLIHFSSRYKSVEILDAIDTLLPPALRAKCVPFLNGFD